MQTSEKQTIHNPHDKLFKASLKHPEVAKEFLTLYLPTHILKELDLSILNEYYA